MIVALRGRLEVGDRCGARGRGPRAPASGRTAGTVGGAGAAERRAHRAGRGARAAERGTPGPDRGDPGPERRPLEARSAARGAARGGTTVGRGRRGARTQSAPRRRRSSATRPPWSSTSSAGDGLAVRAAAPARAAAAISPAVAGDASFAALVLRHNRPASLNDTALRPDLAVPRLEGGPPMRAALCAPVVIDERAAGVIGIYSQTPREWTDEEFRLAEWLARQCAVILGMLRLQANLARRAALLDSQPRCHRRPRGRRRHLLLEPGGRGHVRVSGGGGRGAADTGAPAPAVAHPEARDRRRTRARGPLERRARPPHPGGPRDRRRVPLAAPGRGGRDRRARVQRGRDDRARGRPAQERVPGDPLARAPKPARRHALRARTAVAQRRHRGTPAARRHRAPALAPRAAGRRPARRHHGSAATSSSCGASASTSPRSSSRQSMPWRRRSRAGSTR